MATSPTGSDTLAANVFLQRVTFNGRNIDVKHYCTSLEHICPILLSGSPKMSLIVYKYPLLYNIRTITSSKGVNVLPTDQI